MWALQHFDVYLGSGLAPLVHTDHNPLTFLRSLQNPNQRLMRWALFLQPFHLDVRHMKGSGKGDADALPRAPQQLVFSLFFLLLYSSALSHFLLNLLPGSWLLRVVKGWRSEECSG